MESLSRYSSCPASSTSFPFSPTYRKRPSNRRALQEKLKLNPLLQLPSLPPHRLHNPQPLLWHKLRWLPLRLLPPPQQLQLNNPHPLLRPRYLWPRLSPNNPSPRPWSNSRLFFSNNCRHLPRNNTSEPFRPDTQNNRPSPLPRMQPPRPSSSGMLNCSRPNSLLLPETRIKKLLPSPDADVTEDADIF